MKPKNVMLLGFVNRAVEYLDKHMDEEPDTRLAELKNIDLASLKDELNDNLDASLGTMQSTMSTLLKAGNEAFDQFITDNLGKESISDELNRIFDEHDEDRSNNQEELARLLSFYNLDNDFINEVEEDTSSDEVKEDTPSNEVEETFDEAEINDEEILEQVDEAEEETKVENFTSKDDELLQEIRKNATNDDTQEIMPIDHEIAQDVNIDSIFNEIVEAEQKPNNENNNDVELEEVAIDDNEEKQNDVEETKTYVSSLIDDLRAQLIQEEEAKKAEESNNKDIYENISKLYPYLPESFIKSVYELKESIASEYPIGHKIVILHRIVFKDVDNLRNFVEIGLNHEYTINADEKKMIVDIFKEYINSDGRILTNIYEVANQGYLLDGTYEGYNIILQEDE